MATPYELTQLREMCSGLSAMIVEDDRSLAQSYKDIIGRFFSEVTLLHSAEEALSLHESGKYSIVYTDLEMPNMDGIELIANIKNYDKEQKFIVITASEEQEKLRKLLKLNITSLIIKPFTVDSFFNITRDTVAIILQERYQKQRTHLLNQQLNQITREKELQESILIQQSKLAQTGEMISMISHQWRQPLSSITTIIAGLKTKLDLETYQRAENPYLALEEDLRSAFHRMEESADFLSKTINDFRNFYHMDNEAETFNVVETIQSVCRMVLPEPNGIALNTEFNNLNGVMLHTFEGEFKQVLINIINNAKDVFAEKGCTNPAIRIVLREGENALILHIIDNGGGISEEIIDHIFLPYFSTKEKKNGTGIGLHMAKTIVEQHMRGELSVSNNPLSGGADFRILLPLTPKDRR